MPSRGIQRPSGLTLLRQLSALAPFIKRLHDLASHAVGKHVERSIVDSPPRRRPDLKAFLEPLHDFCI